MIALRQSLTAMVALLASATCLAAQTVLPGAYSSRQ
jgi:hypothetical protein